MPPEPHERTSSKLNIQACSGSDASCVISSRSEAAIRSKVFKMVKSLKCRQDWMNAKPCDVIEVIRYMCERHWFLRTLSEHRVEFYNDEPRFLLTDANQWLMPDGNKYRSRFDLPSLCQDLFWEDCVSDNVILLWQKNTGNSNTLPHINVLNAENCDLNVENGYFCITLRNIVLPSQQQAPAPDPSDRKKRYGIKKTTGNEAGQTVKISKNPVKDVDPSYRNDYDFHVIQNGKRSAGLRYPSGGVILDDLDLIEMFHLGDWVGAYKRREIIRHHKLGYGVTSGQQAGVKTGHASAKRINATSEAMSKVAGAADVATNFDHAIDHVVFPEAFFKHDGYEDVYRRLIYYGGYLSLMLMSSKSQIESNGGYLSHLFRQEIIGRRSRIAHGAAMALNSPTFLGSDYASVPLLELQWSSASSYTEDEIIERVTKLGKTGIASGETCREYARLDNEVESARNLKAHENRKAYAPAFEPSQAMLPGMFPEEFPDAKTPAPASSSSGNEGGRPTNS